MSQQTAGGVDLALLQCRLTLDFAGPAQLVAGDIPAIPTAPIFCGAAKELCLRILLEDRNLALELVGKPDVVAIEECDELTTRLIQREVPAGAFAEIGAPWVAKVTDLVGSAFGDLLRHSRARVGAAIVDQQE